MAGQEMSIKIPLLIFIVSCCVIHMCKAPIQKELPKNLLPQEHGYEIMSEMCKYGHIGMCVAIDKGRPE